MQDPSYRIFTNGSSPDPKERLFAENKDFTSSPFHYSTPVDINSNKNYLAIAEMRNEIEDLIDMKLVQNNLKLHYESNDRLEKAIKNLDLNNQRVSDLENHTFHIKEEINLKLRENESTMRDLNASIKNKSSLFASSLEVGFQKKLETIIEDHDNTKIYKEELDNDSYLYLSMAFSFTALPLFLGYFHIIFFKQSTRFLKRMKYLLCVLLSPILLVPGLATSLLQLCCVWYVYNEAENNFSLIDKLSYEGLKILIIVVLVFMVARETTQAINNFFYCFFESTSKLHFFLAGCFLPSIIQGSMGFLILYVSFLLIASTDDPVDLIQNFASVYILLEIDNIMMNFLRLSKLSIFILYINEKLDVLRAEMGVIPIFSKQAVKRMLIESTLEIDYEDQRHNYKIAFLISRGVVIVALIIFSVLVWIYEVLDKETSY